MHNKKVYFRYDGENLLFSCDGPTSQKYFVIALPSDSPSTPSTVERWLVAPVSAEELKQLEENRIPVETLLRGLKVPLLICTQKSGSTVKTEPIQAQNLTKDMLPLPGEYLY